MPMTLNEYLDQFSWSQTELAKQAKVSLHCVRRALAGEKISRGNAQKIVDALDLKFQKQGAKAHITMGSIRGLWLADLQRQKRESQAK